MKSLINNLILFIVVLLPCPLYGGDDWCGINERYYSPGNPYYCCSNGGNCTWWAWRQATNAWGELPWVPGNAKDWASVLGGSPYNYPVNPTPAVNTIAVNTTAAPGQCNGGPCGHVAWVTRIVGNTVYFTDMDCCSTCKDGASEESASISFFNGGYIYPKGGSNLCGNIGGRTLNAGTYTVTCPIYVNAGSSLHLKPGVVLNYNGHSFTVNGSLIWGP